MTQTQTPEYGLLIDSVHLHDHYIRSLGVPVYKGHFIEDLRTLELGPFKERNCNAAFIQLDGQEFIQEVTVIEVAAGQTTAPRRIALEEMLYVTNGRGQTIIWADGHERKSFEWGPRSVFMIPPNYNYQLSSLQGDQPARVLACNFLPVSLALTPDFAFFFQNPYVNLDLLYGEGGSIYSEAKTIRRGDDPRRPMSLWIGNFFPDLGAWDKMENYQARGAGGHAVYFQSRTGRTAHMSQFPTRTYKKAHRHGPGRVIVIPGGDGYTIIWRPDGERIVLPWHEGSVFTPPNQWFHQHFNLGDRPARYFAMGPPQGPFELEGEGGGTHVEIPYTQEDPWIREYFATELAERGLTSLMPDQAYRDPNYEWSFRED